MKKLFRPITNHGLSELCFRGLFWGHRELCQAALTRYYIFGVLELFVIQTYQELGDIFEDG